MYHKNAWNFLAYKGTLLFLSITISTYLFNQISTYMISIHSFTGLGISSKLIVSLSLSNISEEQVDAWVTDLDNIHIQQGHQTPILLLDAILLSRVTQLGHAGFCHPFGFQGCQRQTQL